MHALADRVATSDRRAPESSGGPARAKYREASGEVRSIICSIRYSIDYLGFP